MEFVLPLESDKEGFLCIDWSNTMVEKLNVGFKWDMVDNMVTLVLSYVVEKWDGCISKFTSQEFEKSLEEISI